MMIQKRLVLPNDLWLLGEKTISDQFNLKFNYNSVLSSSKLGWRGQREEDPPMGGAVSNVRPFTGLKD